MGAATPFGYFYIPAYGECSEAGYTAFCSALTATDAVINDLVNKRWAQDEILPDAVEAETWHDDPTSLLQNLNNIRYRLNYLEIGGSGSWYSKPTFHIVIPPSQRSLSNASYFELQVASDAAFTTVVYSADSLVDQTGWYYFDSVWLAHPAGGVAVGFEHLLFEADDWIDADPTLRYYWRVRAKWDKHNDVESESESGEDRRWGLNCAAYNFGDQVFRVAGHSADHVMLEVFDWATQQATYIIDWQGGYGEACRWVYIDASTGAIMYWNDTNEGFWPPLDGWHSTDASYDPAPTGTEIYNWCEEESSESASASLSESISLSESVSESPESVSASTESLSNSPESVSASEVSESESPESISASTSPESTSLSESISPESESNSPSESNSASNSLSPSLSESISNSNSPSLSESSSISNSPSLSESPSDSVSPSISLSGSESLSASLSLSSESESYIEGKWYCIQIYDYGTEPGCPEPGIPIDSACMSYPFNLDCYLNEGDGHYHRIIVQSGPYDSEVLCTGECS